MEPFTIKINHPTGAIDLHIIVSDEIYQIIANGRMIGALRPPGEDWQLLPLPEIISELPVFEEDLSVKITDELNLDTPTVNLIIGEIENHLYHHK